MTEKPLPDDIDPRLSFYLHDDPRVCYFVGNPHTFPGRIAVYCPDGEEWTAFNVSKSEIASMSPEAQIWLDGYIRGNEPKLAAMAEDTNESDRLWDQTWAEYRRTGDYRGPIYGDD